jgi:hypothetical protein
MTNKDKTRDKLVGSMRKTKAAAGIRANSTETETVAGAAGVEEKVAEEKVVETVAETITEAKTAIPAVKSAKRDVKSAQSAQVSADSYQSGRRVWPD